MIHTRDQRARAQRVLSLSPLSRTVDSSRTSACRCLLAQFVEDLILPMRSFSSTSMKVDCTIMANLPLSCSRQLDASHAPSCLADCFTFSAYLNSRTILPNLIALNCRYGEARRVWRSGCKGISSPIGRHLNSTFYLVRVWPLQSYLLTPSGSAR